jgi:hypothetical protein
MSVPKVHFSASGSPPSGPKGEAALSARDQRPELGEPEVSWGERSVQKPETDPQRQRPQTPGNRLPDGMT